MKDLERRRLDMFARVREFGETQGAEFAEGSRGAELFAVVGEVVGELQKHAAAQAAGAGGGAQGSAGRSAARDELEQQLMAVSRTARHMLPGVPGVAERFRLPRTNRNDQQLVATARDFLAAAEPYKDEFVRNEMPQKFLEHLEAAIAALESAIAEQNRQRGAGVSATESIDDAIDRGMEAVRALDAVVRNKFADDPAALAAWTSASHVERANRAAMKAAPPDRPKPA